jgi:hypothetical protein
MLDHNFTKTLRSSAIAAILFLTACGGGGGSGSGNVGGANATVQGVVQSVRADGVTVNDVSFSTSGATLSSNDDPAVTLGANAGAYLRPGMVVTIHGAVDDRGHGEAAEIRHQDDLVGEIEVHRSGEIVVNGVSVSLDDDTSGLDRRNGATRPEDMPVGTIVAVSGLPDSRGGIRATLVRERDDSPEREVRAFVVAVNGTVLDLAFEPAGPVALRVDVSGIAPAPSFTVGAFVEVQTRGPANEAGVFTATAIHAEDRMEPQAEDWAEVEGIVTAADASGFVVAGQRVVTDASTVVRGGTLADVVPGVKVEAEGVIQGDGSLLARTVKLKPSVRVEANVEAVDVAGGTVTVLGLTVRVTPSTERNGFGDLSDLVPGHAIQVRGTPTSGGAIDALRLDLQDTRPADRAFLRGVVTAKTPTTGLVILGIALDVSGASLGESGPGSTQAFFDAIVPGETVVKVRWRPYPASTSEPVEEMEIEN